MQVTKLSTHNRYLAKQFNLDTDGVMHSKSYDNAKWFDAERLNINDIHQLSSLLFDLESQPFSCLIRGAAQPDTDLNKAVRRRKHIDGKDAQEYPFIDAASSWLLIDIDTLSLPDSYDYIQQPERVVGYAISKLPEEFHNVYCHWQFSSSAGMKNPNLIKLHLWFWLDTPSNSYTLKQWAKQVNILNGNIVDESLFSPVQIHYTASPIFHGDAKDPIKIRSGLLEGENESVTINLDLPKLDVGIQQPQLITTQSISNQSSHGKIIGFDNHLAQLGDDLNGDGFYNPLLRATSSIVATKGTEWVKHNLASIIADIQDRIEDADQSNHSHEDIIHYKSEDYLAALIQGAIDKGYGDKVKSELPYYNVEPLSLKEGEAKLLDAIRRFHACIVMANKKRKPETLTTEQKAGFSTRKQNIAIKAAAGLGKTSQIIRELIAMRVKSNKRVNIEYYIPTHNLGTQVEIDIKRAFADKAERIESITGESARVDVNVIYGRGNKTSDGINVCRKTDEATALSKLGKSVEFLLCNNGTEKCEFYDNCLYQQQFKVADSEVAELNLPTVNIMAHNHLFHNKRELLSKPEFIVVDESFYQAGIETIEIALDRIRGGKNRITKVIYDALYDDEPLLKALRDEGLTPAVLEEEAKGHRPQLGISNISPAMSWEQQQKELSGASSDYIKMDILLNTLSDELSITDRDDSYTVSKNKDKAVINKRMEMNVPDDVPILFIDADLNRSITNLYRPDTQVIDIPVERLATVHQFNRTWSAHSLNNETNSLFKETREFIDLVTATGSTLIVTSKSVRVRLTGESASAMPVKGEYRDAAIVHFSNLRGINDYSSYQNVIVIGREQPPARAMERLTKGLWWDNNKPISTVPEEGGSYPYLRNQKRGYRMRNHSPEDAEVQLHPDKRVQDLLELAREAEITQGIDRLRLVRGNKDRQVFILTNVPVDITVDYLWSWDRLTEFLKCWEESDGVLPLKAEDLLKVLPDLNLTVRGAKDLAARLKKTLPLIDILISQDVLFGSYRTNTPKGVAPKVIISKQYVNPKASLQEKLGVTVTAFNEINTNK